MANVPIERVLERLWPQGDDERAFAIFDAARDDAVHPLVTRSGRPHRCLYIGDIAPVLARAAPWIVNLSRNDKGSRELLQRAWGESWGIFLRSSAGLPTLHDHFRRFLRVQDERGAKMLFRYYDPRVMRAYLPTCTPAELAYVFGPVEAYVIEGESPESVGEYRFTKGALARSEVRAEKRLHWLGDYLRKNRDA